MEKDADLEAIIVQYDRICRRFRPETIDRHRLRVALGVDARVLHQQEAR